MEKKSKLRRIFSSLKSKKKKEEEEKKKKKSKGLRSGNRNQNKQLRALDNEGY